MNDLNQPAIPAPPEAKTEGEKLNYAFGWFKALEYAREKGASNQKMNLSRQQILKLFEIANHLRNVEHFTVETDESSGIGVGIIVSFGLFSENDAKVDITEVNKW